jgi:hypothetical protein
MAWSNGAIEDFIATSAERQTAVLRLRNYQVDFLPGGPMLVVTFEPTAHGRTEPDLDRPAWGQAFLSKRGHSVLGVKREVPDWYRGSDLHHAFRGLQKRGFFSQFSQVVFYGPSMGGYAALAFASCAPGCTVLAMNPQSTLAPDICWFDQRFAGARAAAWQGDFVDGAVEARAAARIYVCYDPYQIKDRLHVERLHPANLMRLRLPFAGHTTALALNTLGILGHVFDQAAAGTLDEPGFRRLARERVRLADYHLHLAERGLHLPRRQRHLHQALAIDPANTRARKLQQRLAGPAAQPRGTASTRRWPLGIVTTERVPLVYLNIPQSGSTTIQNHLHCMAWGHYPAAAQDIHQNAALRRSREDSDATHELISRQVHGGAFVFTFVRDPGRRAYASFNEKIFHAGRHSFVAIARELQASWGVRLHLEGQTPTLTEHRENFGRFLGFVEASLAGKTGIRRDPHWCPQGPMVTQYKRFMTVNYIGKLENFPADMAEVLHRAGVHRIPDVRFLPWRHAPPPYPFDEVLDTRIQTQLDRLYGMDYINFGYPRGA